jgi:hypothetical protein
MDFNSKVLQLKMRKVDIIEKVGNLYSRLSEINKELGVQDETVKYSIDDKVENPNNVYTVTDEEIEAYRLELIQRDIDEKAKHKTGGKGKGNKGGKGNSFRSNDNRGHGFNNYLHSDFFIVQCRFYVFTFHFSNRHNDT